MLDSVPAEMVAKLLERGYEVAKDTAGHAARMADNRARIRASLEDLDVIYQIPDDLLDATDLADDEVAAVDGAFICDNQSIGDLCTAVAVSVGPRDGQGDSDIFMESVPRNARNKDRIAAVMAGMELLTASRLDAKVVLVDGGMTSSLITLSKTLYDIGDSTDVISERVRAFVNDDTRQAVISLLTDPRFVALPKYTTTNDMAHLVPAEFKNQDAKTLATLALRPGEATFWIEKPDNIAKRSIGKALGFSEADEMLVKRLQEEVVSCYYRPHPWTWAFRLDVARSTTDDDDATLRIFKAIRDNTLTSGILEPFPLYLVDQYAKKISAGSEAMVSMAAMANLDDDDAQLMLAMRYRS
jgi:hypothetical protein